MPSATTASVRIRTLSSSATGATWPYTRTATASRTSPRASGSAASVPCRPTAPSPACSARPKAARSSRRRRASGRTCSVPCGSRRRVWGTRCTWSRSTAWSASPRRAGACAATCATAAAAPASSASTAPASPRSTSCVPGVPACSPVSAGRLSTARRPSRCLPRTATTIYPACRSWHSAHACEARTTGRCTRTRTPTRAPRASRM